jgi:amidohydrolase
MDGLPITEIADIPYKSQHDGCMHACGHDGHMSSLLAAAKVLHSTRDSFRGTVKLVFQPAEEGRAGAREMIKEGVLEEGPCGPRIDAIYGIHIWSPGAVGEIQCSEGPVMAAGDRFDINVRGKGGHGAMPAGTVDAIVEAAAVVTSLQTIISRNKDPMQTGVVTCGSITGGYANNIIADQAKICGTYRYFQATCTGDCADTGCFQIFHSRN